MTAPKYSQPSDRSAFEIAIICALQIESDAVEALFDDFWDEQEYGKATGDPNSYTLGRIGRHHVVLVYMPGMGKGSSASVAASFRSSFPSVRLDLVVGICGGVPFVGSSHAEEILLGDVIISTGVIQFDFGRQFSDRIVRKDTLQDNLGRPNSEIRSFLNKMQGWRARTELRRRLCEYVAEVCGKEGFEGRRHPALDEDKLYRAAYRHKHQDLTVCSICAQCVNDGDTTCEIAPHATCAQLQCDDSQLVARKRIEQAQKSSLTTDQAEDASKPAIHFGLVASGDVVMKSASHRDRLAAEESVIAIEMEGAGVWDNFPTVIIKGVCDYADSHKNKKWRPYAAVTAAACAKALLREWPGMGNAGLATQVAGATNEWQHESGPNMRITQGESQFRGPTIVTGGRVFQGNFVGLGQRSPGRGLS